ncbi:hypothetical protein [Kribbella sp. NPDC051620]|uniref:hypothetical protein n=1 Tax=Kribbella sp. NPDC051620 TaxID=3364120 RepID=UPI00378D09E1
MNYELLLLVVITVGLTVRALWASAVLHRHVGWLVAVSWTGGLVGGIGLESDWLAIPCLLVFLVSEFIYQTGRDGSSKAPPARWLGPLRRLFSAGTPGQHARNAHDNGGESSDP